MEFLNGGYSPPNHLPVSHADTDAFLNDWATQMAVVEASRRLARNSNGQKSSSGTRISKPSSANNSPRAYMANRRRTLATGGQQSPMARQPAEQLSMPSEAVNRPARPLSWHPNSQLQTPHGYFQQQREVYPVSATSVYGDHRHDLYNNYPQLSPMMQAQSTHASPASMFSSLPIGYPSAGPQYLTPDGWELGHSHDLYLSQYAPSFVHTTQNTPGAGNADWPFYMMPNTATTSPPTPDSFIHSQQQPAVSQTLEEPEDEGEILVGMGLYDQPEKIEDDPQLNNYRSTVTSLLGSTFRHHESPGKGLKLEETWEPPQSEEDEEDEDEDSE